MTFFDPKEDVIDIELTQFGKSAMSNGRWKPVYYSFYDDDIIYDPEYGGITEGQNSAQDRIVEAARTRTQSAFGGIETEIKKQYERIPKSGNEFERINLQPTVERDYALSTPMGRSDIGNEYFPAWQVSFLNGELSSSVIVSTSSLGTIPIIELVADDITFVTQIKDKDDEDAAALDLANNLNQIGESSPIVEPSTLVLANQVYDDGTYVSIDEDYLLLELVEDNTPFEPENMDIEVFLHSPETGSKGEPVLIPLKFNKRKEMIVNDILIDDDDPERNQQTELTSEYVEYFFNVWVDDEIDILTLCKAVSLRKELGIYTPPIDCPERAVGPPGPPTEPCYEECCEFLPDGSPNPEWPECLEIECEDVVPDCDTTTLVGETYTGEFDE